MRMQFAIASNINFEKYSVPILIESMVNCGIDLDSIYVFSGGYQEYQYERREGYHYYMVDHNSYDYTPLISIVELEIESEYWFLIHDTSKVGSNFKKLAYNIPDSKPEKIALQDHPSMSIGAYRYDYLMKDYVKKRILSVKNTDYSKESMDKWKVWGVHNEDYILHKTDPPPCLYSSESDSYHLNNTVIIDYNNWYGTKTTRRTEYYKSLDLYKNKSNWKLPIENFLDI